MQHLPVSWTAMGVYKNKNNVDLNESTLLLFVKDSDMRTVSIKSTLFLVDFSIPIVVQLMSKWRIYFLLFLILVIIIINYTYQN